MQRNGVSQVQTPPVDTKFILSALATPPQPNPAIFVPTLIDYSQSILIQKINAYRAQKKQEIITEPGFCHGLTLVWLKAKAKDKEKKLFNLIKKIINTPNDKLAMIGEEIEVLFRKINEKQNPTRYKKKYPILNITYKEIDLILKTVEKQVAFDSYYTKNELSELIAKHAKKGNMFCVTTGFVIDTGSRLSKHSIGMFVGDKEFFVFDANYTEGDEKKFSTPETAANEILDRMCTPFNLNVPQQCSLEIKMVRYKSKKCHATKISNLALEHYSIENNEMPLATKKASSSPKSKHFFSKLTHFFHSKYTQKKRDILDTRSLLNSVEMTNDAKNTL